MLRRSFCPNKFVDVLSRRFFASKWRKKRAIVKRGKDVAPVEAHAESHAEPEQLPTASEVSTPEVSRPLTFVKGEKQLVRDFISRSLYDTDGYFNAEKELGARIWCTEPIKFHELVGQTDWRKTLTDLYAKNHTSFLTPVEVFKPHYAECVVRWLLSSRQETFSPLRIYEVGGGNGSMATGILDYIKKFYPEIYDETEYTIIELSTAFHKIQQQSLGHHKNFKSVNKSCVDWSTVVHQECFVIASEVLDNMPHDKVTWSGKQVSVEQDEKEAWEVLEPITDHYVEEYIEILKEYKQYWKNATQWFWTETGWRERNRQFEAFLDGRLWKSNGFSGTWLPTVQLQFFEMLGKYFPNHHLFIADFEWLPDTLHGRYAPLVASRGAWTGGKTITHPTYLVPQGTADIFFPTDFELLRFVYTQKTGAPYTEILSHKEFIMLYGKPDHTETRTGYNPMIEDYKNFKYLVTDRVPPGSLDDEYTDTLAIDYFRQDTGYWRQH